MSSSAVASPLYGRSWQVDVEFASGTVTLSADWQEPSLRVTFDIQQLAYNIYWNAEIVVFNPSQDTALELLGANSQQANVVVQAGYKNNAPGYGMIWSGPVFQAFLDRENVVDLKLTLRCLVGLGDIGRNFISQNFVAGVSQADMISKIARQAFTPFSVKTVSPNINSAPLSRGVTVFGRPSRYIDDIAKNNNAQWWMDKDGLSVSGASDSDIPTEPTVVFTPPLLPAANSLGTPVVAPQGGIIVGTPQQTAFGVSFRALLDSRVQVTKPYTGVKIDNTQLRKQRLAISPGNTPQISILDQDGFYVVAGARFLGDTRGNDWYVDVDGYTTGVAKLQMLEAIANVNTNAQQ
jgi:hypothetical protein